MTILQEPQKIIYNYVDVERNLCITYEEIQLLLETFPYGHPYRIGFALLACCGMRGAELCDMKLTDFLKEDLTLLQYRIKKGRGRQYNTGLHSITIKMAKRNIPKVLADEIKWYLLNNSNLIKNGMLFNFDESSLRRYLSQLRIKARKGLLSEKLSKALLDQTCFRLAFGVNNCPPLYRIGLHSFRRFYITFCNNSTHQDLSELCRHIGHTLKDTTMQYVYRPENIGLPAGFKHEYKTMESLLFHKEQTRIGDFIK